MNFAIHSVVYIYSYHKGNRIIAGVHCENIEKLEYESTTVCGIHVDV